MKSTPSDRSPPAAHLPDLELASLLATRLCHDLSGPIGALAAGTELLSDPDFLQETTALLDHSSAGAMARLKLLRAAFGISGGADSAFEDCLRAYGDATHGSDITLGFALDDPHLFSQGSATTARHRQLALNMALLLLDCLPGRGTVDLRSTLDAETGKRVFQVEAQARRLNLSPAHVAALSGQRDGLSPRTVQAYWVFCLSQEVGGIEVWHDEGRLRLSVRLPNTACSGS